MTATANEMRAAFPGGPVPAQGGTAAYELGGHALLLAVSGVGLVNTALMAGWLLGRADVAGAVNLGIAGGYDLQRTPLLRACFAEGEVWPEYGLLGADGLADARGIGFAQGRVRGEQVWDRLELSPREDAEAMNLGLGADWTPVTGVTVSGVSGTPERAALLREARGGGMESMEGFGLAYAAALAGKPFLEVRTISNLAGSRGAGDWDLKGALRALAGATATLFAAQSGACPATSNLT
ncbi:futalosine nucleosidase [Pseudodesulfovibrio mercurii]|uniref:Futalosine hydrolase n=2 Tax=Pseudodesulfovibrio mercurii TaxID=641491 RepID=F0JFX4_9BACT|nr:futalosine nucleosidase [Pseudodesulfovibrio mercurii]